MAHAKYRAEVIQKHKDDIVELFNNGIRPVDIVRQIRSRAPEDSEAIAVSQIHNALARHRRDELAGRTPLQFLYDELATSDEELYFRDLRNPAGRLSSLFVSPRSGITLLREFPNIMEFDCTYKTNRYNMPLLNICASTSEGKTFSVASVVMSGEDEPRYAWALTTLLALLAREGIPLPQVIVTDRDLALVNAITNAPKLKGVTVLLCRWHVSKNVLAKCMHYFPAARKDSSNRVTREQAFKEFHDDWTLLVASKDVTTFQSRLKAFQTASYPAAAIGYCIKTWIGPWKEKIVTCFVDQNRHFGHRTTSVVEGLHSSMKIEEVHPDLNRRPYPPCPEASLLLEAPGSRS
ncbi:hypothetical protein HIM_12662 [Hirsutella minnesotensis 3608]|uniref:MULE transposase domain-containing protein n=1 Tax=Hirsutella minnesotensis 3608 TaxID=1043627 RepID=A0A0F7ZQJ0_9HYPO|nr:hypothetical protein HIM_12662 [Hirsutella minnesotensis 3608]